MSTPFLAEIRIFGFDFPPRGWALCDGQILPINQNQSLYSLLGTDYGGDGRTTFALPDLRGRTPLHHDDREAELRQGQRGGSEGHSLSAAEMPAHDHALVASAEVASSPAPAGNLLAKKGRFGPDVYAAPADLTALRAESVASAGGGAAHENMQPFQVLNFCIATQGVFPSRN